LFLKDMKYIQGNNRNQTFFLTLDDQLAAYSPVRLMDAFSLPAMSSYAGKVFGQGTLR
jgi:hypothetical protein